MGNMGGGTPSLYLLLLSGDPATDSPATKLTSARQERTAEVQDELKEANQVLIWSFGLGGTNLAGNSPNFHVERMSIIRFYMCFI